MILVFVSIAGGALGAALLAITPERVLMGLIPLLLGFATILFAFSGQIGGWLRARGKGLAGTRWRVCHLGMMMLPVSIYTGYFSAGAGVLIIAVLSVGTQGNYRIANVSKNLLSSLNGAVAAVVFAIQGAIVWQHTLVLMSGALVGGLLGGRIARLLPPTVARVAVVAAGGLLTAFYGSRYWA